MTHTPTPWKVYDNGNFIEIVPEKWNKDLPFAIGNVCSSYPTDKDQGLQQANAAHIVKCVNLHDELVEVLKWISDNSMCEGAVFASSEALKKAGAL